jgi:gluconolactonase
MRTRLRLAALLLAGLALLPVEARAQDQKATTASQKTFTVVPLWPTGSATLKGADEKEIVEPKDAGPGQRINSIRNVHNPSIEVHLPPVGTANGCAVIVAPGGGHNQLVWGSEGRDIADWLNGIGVTAFVLKYRLARTPGYMYTVEGEALQDTQRALRIVRARAREWGVDPARVGILGFSAGGALAALADIRFDRGVPDAADTIERQSCRPDFVGLVYAGWGKMDITAPRDAAPAFLTSAGKDDASHARQTVEFYNSLFDAGVPVELHIYGHGGHGGGIRARNGIPFGTWQNRLVDWMGDLGVLKMSDSSAAAVGAASVIAPGAGLEKLAGDFAFTEGPASDSEGNVFFTDQPNDKILKWSVDGKLSTFLEPAGRSNGLSFDEAGNLWACADELNQLWCITPAKNGTAKSTVKVVLKADLENRLLNGPNDVWIRPGDRGLYFTDPLYKRPYWKRDPAMQTKGQFVYYSTMDGKMLRPVATDLTQPNGIIGTPDGRTLYVADIGANKTYSYDIGADGTLTNKKLFHELGSDGMTIDDAGNVYLTGKGVTVIDKTGKLVENIAVPESWTANVCFGGKDRRTLFITASKGLYAIRTRTRGVGSQ